MKGKTKLPAPPPAAWRATWPPGRAVPMLFLAEGFQNRRTKVFNRPMEADLDGWVADLEPRMAKKLAAVGLIPKAEAKGVATLAAFLKSIHRRPSRPETGDKDRSRAGDSRFERILWRCPRRADHLARPSRRFQAMAGRSGTRPDDHSQAATSGPLVFSCDATAEVDRRKPVRWSEGGGDGHSRSTTVRHP